jgi:hypothetical protein
MQSLSVIPRQCSAITKKGKQCRKPAILGATTCKVHARPSPRDTPGVMAGLPKVALSAFFEAVVKVGIQFVVEHVHELWQNGVLHERPLFFSKQADSITTEELEAWYDALDSQTQAIILKDLRTPHKTERTFQAGGESN